VPRVPRRLIPLVLAVGLFDTGANALIAVATTRGSIGIVAVLSALYPIATILLARAVLHERLGPTRTAGGLIALGGAALIAAG
jgi:drug/metabolite transporter (DMT)-like permease